MSKKLPDIAVLGPKKTSSDMALQKHAPKREAIYAPSISDAFDLLEKGKVREALVPLENSLGGSVRETLDELYGRNVHIAGLVSLPIHLALVASKRLKPSQITTLYSHPQPFLQCRNFIKKNCSKATRVPVESTVTAVGRVKGESAKGASNIPSRA